MMNRIKAVLSEKKMSQIELSDKLEKSYNMVNSYVQNRRQPSVEVLFKISEILGVNVQSLLINNTVKDENN